MSFKGISKGGMAVRRYEVVVEARGFMRHFDMKISVALSITIYTTKEGGPR